MHAQEFALVTPRQRRHFSSDIWSKDDRDGEVEGKLTKENHDFFVKRWICSELRSCRSSASGFLTEDRCTFTSRLSEKYVFATTF